MQLTKSKEQELLNRFRRVCPEVWDLSIDGAWNKPEAMVLIESKNRKEVKSMDNFGPPKKKGVEL